MNMKNVGWGAPDADVFDFVLENSRTVSGPFLSYVITMTSHGPFTNASNYYNNATFDDIQDKKVRDYFNSMSYVDASIKSFVQSIKKEYDNAYVFIFGDHTPKIESDYFIQADVMIEDKLHEFVPLFIITPDNKVHNEQKIAASFLDIAPTVLYA
jgi:phosphoglycerol transferase MdoB-like AlkP superfamily enzyme